MNWHRTVVIVIASLASIVTLSGCNTVEGAGEDVQSVGRGIEGAAEGAK
jgi:predicted small secreted protein